MKDNWEPARAGWLGYAGQRGKEPGVRGEKLQVVWHSWSLDMRQWATEMRLERNSRAYHRLIMAFIGWAKANLGG